MAKFKPKPKTDALKRLERYLGQRAAGECHKPSGAERNLKEIAPKAFEYDVVFIAFDCEGDGEGGVSEVGISILDTRNIANIPPKKTGKDWRKQIRRMHYLVAGKDRELGNYEPLPKLARWVETDPAAFNKLGFGTTLEVQQEEVKPGILKICSEFPGRNIVVVLHDGNSEDTFLGKFGIVFENLPGVIDRLDTQDLDRARFRHLETPKRENGRKLRVMIEGDKLNSSSTGYHNAGIDAYYTLRYALMCAVRDGKVDKSEDSEWDTPESDGGAPMYK